MTTQRKEKTLRIIYNHPGKRVVYELYKKTNPELAKKYLTFISRHQAAQYITWDPFRQKFVA